MIAKKITLLVVVCCIFGSCIPCKVVELPIEPIDVDQIKVDFKDDYTFVAYTSPPELIGGYRFIRKNVVYPDSARRNCVQAKVTVYVLVNEKGFVERVDSVQDDHGWGFNKAATAVVKKTKWVPAKKDGTPVKVRILIPVMFKP